MYDEDCDCITRDIIVHDVEVMTLDKPNKNDRIYSSDVVSRTLKNSEFPIFGQIGMPDLRTLPDPYDALKVPEDKVSHRVERLTIKDGSLFADIRLLRTPQGLVLQNLFNQNPNAFKDRVKFRTAGITQLGSDGKEITNFTLYAINAIDAALAA